MFACRQRSRTNRSSSATVQRASGSTYDHLRRPPGRQDFGLRWRLARSFVRALTDDAHHDGLHQAHRVGLCRWTAIRCISRCRTRQPRSQLPDHLPPPVASKACGPRLPVPTGQADHLAGPAIDDAEMHRPRHRAAGGSREQLGIGTFTSVSCPAFWSARPRFWMFSKTSDSPNRSTTGMTQASPC